MKIILTLLFVSVLVTSALAVCTINDLPQVEQVALAAANGAPSCGSGVTCAIASDNNCHAVEFTIDVTWSGAGISEISFPFVTQSKMIQITGNAALMTVAFPAATTISGGNYGIYIRDNGVLTTVAFPAATTISGTGNYGILIAYNAALTTVAFPAATTISGGNNPFFVETNGILTCINLALYGDAATGINQPDVTVITSTANQDQHCGFLSATREAFPTCPHPSFGLVDPTNEDLVYSCATTASSYEAICGSACFDGSAVCQPQEGNPCQNVGTEFPCTEGDALMCEATTKRNGAWAIGGIYQTE